MSSHMVLVDSHNCQGHLGLSKVGQASIRTDRETLTNNLVTCKPSAFGIYFPFQDLHKESVIHKNILVKLTENPSNFHKNPSLDINLLNVTKSFKTYVQRPCASLLNICNSKNMSQTIFVRLSARYLSPGTSLKCPN